VNDKHYTVRRSDHVGAGPSDETVKTEVPCRSRCVTIKNPLPSGKFNIFSDHSPICFKLSNVLILSLDREHVQVQGTGRTVYKSIKWKENNTQLVLNDLCKNKLFYKAS
jgi:hypothetical protein